MKQTIFMMKGEQMETRIAALAILVESAGSVETLNALCGKLGRLPGVSAKAVTPKSAK